jgi:iron complex outermembrane receptor protein
MINLPASFELDSVLRYVDNLNQLGPFVPSYVSLDLRLGWRPTPDREFAIVGQNRKSGIANSARRRHAKIFHAVFLAR